MRSFFKAFLSLTVLVAVAACNPVPKSSSAKKVSDQDPIVQNLDEFEGTVRIAAANKRIDELEKKVGELEATPDKLDLDLLNQRVTALEVKKNETSALLPEMPSPNGNTIGPRPTASAARQTSNTQKIPMRSSTFKLPDLEHKPRLATPVETEAFSSGK
jgi:hypothetical protein